MSSPTSASSLAFPVKLEAKVGGWSSLRMVERYAHVNDAELARAVRVTHAHAEAATKTPTAGKMPRAGTALND